MTKRNFRRGLTIDAVEYSHLRGRIDMEEVLEDLGIDYSHRVRPEQLMCHCPDLQGNHKNGDINPSFGVNEDKLAYNCFVCGGGNIIELVQMMRPEYAHRFDNDLEKDREALLYLERFADFNKSDDLSAKVAALLHPQSEAPVPMPDYPPDSLFQYRKIHPYLYERGLTKDVIVDMQVGYDDDHPGIVIPHFFMGKLVGIQRRHLAQDENGNYLCLKCGQDGKPVPKYKNTPNFPKVNTLYAYDRMKRFVKEDGRSSAIVVESPFTALKLMSLGFNRVAATFGQFNYEQAMLLHPLETVYFWPDNDKAGWENTDRCITALNRFTVLKIVPVVPTPKGDAAELDRPEEIVAYLKRAYPASILKLFPSYGTNKLPTLEDVLAQTEH